MHTATHTPGGPARVIAGLAVAVALAVTLADLATRDLCLLDLRRIAASFSVFVPGTLLPDDDRTIWRRGELVPAPWWQARAPREADRSADGFILNPWPWGSPRRFPLPEVWRDHPLKVWAAVCGASRTCRRDVGDTGREVGERDGKDAIPAASHPTTAISTGVGEDRTRPAFPSEVGDGPGASGVSVNHRVIAVARLAGRAEPDNGAAWLAEALAELSGDRLHEGLAALAAACARPVWRVPQRAVFEEARRLYASLGLPRLAAAREAARLHGFPQLLACILCLRQQLAVHAADLVAAATIRRLIVCWRWG